MIAIADDRWPGLTAIRSGPFTMAAATALLIAGDNVLRRREPFVLAVMYDDADPSAERDPGADTFLARWLEANDTLWREWCRGCAIFGAGPDRVEPLVAWLGEIGRPVATFADQESGEAWLVDRVEESRRREVAE